MRGILNKIDCAVLFVSHDALTSLVQPLLANHELPTLQHVVTYDEQSEPPMHVLQSEATRQHYATHYHVQLHAYSHVRQLGKQHHHIAPLNPPATPHTVAAIVFTSGTTGTPRE